LLQLEGRRLGRGLGSRGGRAAPRTSTQLSKTLREAQRGACLVVLDLRELTFIDCWGVDVVLGAVHRVRRKGHRLMLVRGPAEVDRVFTLSAASSQVTILDLDPSEPAPALHLV